MSPGQSPPVKWSRHPERSEGPCQPEFDHGVEGSRCARGDRAFTAGGFPRRYSIRVMDHPLAVLLLAVTGIAGLLLIPLGLPGLWLIVLGILSYGWLTDFRTLTAGLVALAIGLALLGEAVEAWIGFRFARRYGGSRRAGWARSRAA